MKKFILSCFALAALSSSAFAQSSPFEWKIGDNTKIKLGGYVRFNLNYDFDGSVGEKNDFQPVNITTPDWGAEQYLNYDPTASRFSLQITQATEDLGDVKVFVEADFRNTANAVRLRQAYIEMCGVTAGYAWSFMSDLASNAPTIDITGVNSRTFLRTMMVGYRHSISDKLSAGIAIETPSLKSAYPEGCEAVNQIMPNVPAYIQLKGNKGHIKAAVAVRTLKYGDSIDETQEISLGWGGQLSGSLNASKTLKLFGQAIYGEGINNYINDLSGLNINMYPSDNQTMAATPMGGASLGFSAKLAKKWTYAASGSIVENFGDSDDFAGNYKRGSYLSSTLLYAPAPRVTLGAEYLTGSRENFGSDAEAAQRFSLMIKYTL
ncbi:MAG: DcaP family trimeric outer membrane transporter [Rikenellaceae bacterium]